MRIVYLQGCFATQVYPLYVAFFSLFLLSNSTSCHLMTVCTGHMSERDFNTYMELFNNMSNFMKKPNIIVHLDVKPEESLRR